jgi:hypothetical protein
VLCAGVRSGVGSVGVAPEVPAPRLLRVAAAGVSLSLRWSPRAVSAALVASLLVRSALGSRSRCAPCSVALWPRFVPRFGPPRPVLRWAGCRPCAIRFSKAATKAARSQPLFLSRLWAVRGGGRCAVRALPLPLGALEIAKRDFAYLLEWAVRASELSRFVRVDSGRPKRQRSCPLSR